MEAKDKKPVVSSTFSSKAGKQIVDAVSSANRPVPQSVKRSAVDGSTTCQPDPTRFGDWERAGRCIDF